MKRVLIGAIACLAWFSIQAEDCSGAQTLAQSGKAPLTVNVSSSTSTAQAGSKTISAYRIVGSAAFDQVDVKQLVGGDNSVAVPTVPAPPVGCILVPPSNNMANLTLKASARDTGLRISKTLPTLIVFDTAAVPANIIVNSSAPFAVGQVLTITWF